MENCCRIDRSALDRYRKLLALKRIWPLDDEPGLLPDEVVVAEEEERAGALAVGTRLDAPSFRHLPSSLTCGDGCTSVALADVSSSFASRFLQLRHWEKRN